MGIEDPPQSVDAAPSVGGARRGVARESRRKRPALVLATALSLLAIAVLSVALGRAVQGGLSLGMPPSPRPGGAGQSEGASPGLLPSLPPARPDERASGNVANAETTGSSVPAGGVGEASSGPSPKPAPTSAPPNAAAVCGNDEARGIVESFLGAYNRGDQRAVAGFFGRHFKWYSATSPEKHFVAYRVADALEYLDRRYALGERLALHQFFLAGPTGTAPRDSANFWFEVERTVEGRIFRGIVKGAMDCEAREIFVWSMGSSPSRTYAGDAPWTPGK